MNRLFGFVLIWILALGSCSCEKKQLHTVSVAEFQQFVQETGYLTDAEKYGWSFIQTTIFSIDTLSGLSWRVPDGEHFSKPNYAVTQVSYNDALAYAKWSSTSIPTYKGYWKLVKEDSRLINASSVGILPIDQVNFVGNVWDITQPDALGRIRLAGGSYLCDKNTCNGTSPDRELFVDVETGNTHIGFSVIQ